MALRARVELRGSLTHTHGGRSFKKGQPQILTNPSEIKYYEAAGGFMVTVLEEPKTKVGPPAPTAPAPTSKPSGGWDKPTLLKKNKADLIAVATEEFGVVASDDMSKAAIADAILEAQADLEGDDEDLDDEDEADGAD